MDAVKKCIVADSSAHSMDPWHRYASFLSKHYSSHSLLVVVVGLYCSAALVIAKMHELYSARPYTHLLCLFTAIAQGLLLLGAMSMTYVWMHKTEQSSKQPNQLECNVALAQTLSPVLIAAGLGTHVFIEFSYGGNDIDETLLAQSGLKVFHLIIFFVLRDTKFSSIAIAWGICLASLLACCIYTQSSERFSAMVSYFFTTSIIYYDSHRQSKEKYAIIDRLQETLAENERLAVEAQALELRAMIGNVAHDLKTPLTSILSGIECMTEVVASWERQLATSADAASATAFAAAATENIRALRNCLKNMHGSNTFMTMTINRCIDYTKASKGVKLVPKMATAALQEDLAMPVDLMRTVQSAVEIKLSPLDAGISTHIITDQQWLIENLLCLLSNAVKYSHKGTVEVGVDLEGAPSTPSEPQFLRFEVQDSGVGLSEEAMQTLFNPFKQAQRLAGGTGLGLFSLAKRVEALSGQYGVSRRPDGCQGSVFWFTIPYRPDRLSASVASAEVQEADALEERTDEQCANRHVHQHSTAPTLDDGHKSLPPQCVLVVDDAALIVKMTSMLLSRKGHTVESAVNGAEALEKLVQGYERTRSGSLGGDGEQAEGRSTPYDVVLMDLQMPVLDGLEAIRRLRAWEARAHGSGVPAVFGTEAPVITAVLIAGFLHKPYHQLVIALSANSDEETRLEALEAGADAFMAKPFSYENFLGVMETCSQK